MCYAGTTTIGGQCNIVGGSTSSYCADVLLAVLWSLSYCHMNSPDGLEASGIQAANGNSHLWVVTSSTNVYSVQGRDCNLL